jgi:hypothetical protein
MFRTKKLSLDQLINLTITHTCPLCLREHASLLSCDEAAKVAARQTTTN